MKKLALLTFLLGSFISTATMAESVVGELTNDAEKTVGGVVGGAVGASTGVVEGAVVGTDVGAKECYDAAGAPILCSTVGAASGTAEGTVEGAEVGAVEGVLKGSGQE